MACSTSLWALVAIDPSQTQHLSRARRVYIVKRDSCGMKCGEVVFAFLVVLIHLIAPANAMFQ